MRTQNNIPTSRHTIFKGNFCLYDVFTKTAGRYGNAIRCYKDSNWILLAPATVECSFIANLFGKQQPTYLKALNIVLTRNVDVGTGPSRQ